MKDAVRQIIQINHPNLFYLGRFTRLIAWVSMAILCLLCTTQQSFASTEEEEIHTVRYKNNLLYKLDTVKKEVRLFNGISTLQGYRALKKFLQIHSYQNRLLNQKILDSLKQGALKYGDPEGEELYYMIKGVNAYIERKADTALVALRMMRAIPKSPINKFYYAKGLEAYAEIISRAGQTDSALRFLQEALDIFNEAKDNLHLGHTYNQIGVTYGITGLASETIKFYKLSGEAYKRANFLDGYFGAQNNIADILLRQSKPDSALLILKEVLNEIKSNPINHSILLVIQFTTAEAYMAKGDFENALAYLQKSYESAKKGYAHQAVAAIEFMADIYLKQGKKAQAIKTYQEAAKAFLEEKAIFLAARIFGKIADLYVDQNRYDSAYKYLALSSKAVEQSRTESALRANEEFNKKFQLLEKEKEVALQSSENKRLSQQIENFKRVQILQVVIILLVVAGLVFFLIINRKINRQKKELELTKNALEQANHTKDKLFTIVAHDLRGPIGSLNSLPTLIRTATDEEGKLLLPIEHIASAIEKSVGPVYNLMEDLLVWAQANQQQLSVELKHQPISPIINKLKEVYSPIASTKNINLFIEEPEVGLSAKFDENSFFTILRNLTGNALKFTPAQGSVSIITQKKQGEKVLISIQDTGQGMDPAQIENIYHQEKRTTTEGTAGEKGSGMGLMLVMELAKLNSIKVNIESQKGIGTTIKLLLPE